MPKVPALGHLQSLGPACDELLRALASVKEAVRSTELKDEPKRSSEVLLQSFQALQEEVDQLRSEVVLSSEQLQGALEHAGFSLAEKGLGHCVAVARSALVGMSQQLRAPQATDRLHVLREKKHYYSRYYRNCVKIFADERQALKQLIELPPQRKHRSFKAAALAVIATLRMKRKGGRLGRPTEGWKGLM